MCMNDAYDNQQAMIITQIFFCTELEYSLYYNLIGLLEQTTHDRRAHRLVRNRLRNMILVGVIIRVGLVYSNSNHICTFCKSEADLISECWHKIKRYKLILYLEEEINFTRSSHMNTTVQKKKGNCTDLNYDSSFKL